MKHNKYSTLAIVVATVSAMQIAPVFAFDASEVIKKDASPREIFQSFFKFKKDGKQEEAVEVLKFAAQGGNSAAQWKLARIYQTGDGVEQDALEAFKIFQKIANQATYAIPNSDTWQFGADAFVALGNYYRNGISNTIIKPDATKARVMYTTAAMIYRHPEAQFELGRMQINNDKVYGQGRSGVRNLSLAYQKGHVGAEALLGYAIFEGVNTTHNPIRGLVMIGNAQRRASARDVEWINQLYDEAYSIAKPEDRIEAVRQLQNLPNPLE